VPRLFFFADVNRHFILHPGGRRQYPNALRDLFCLVTMVSSPGPVSNIRFARDGHVKGNMRLATLLSVVSISRAWRQRCLSLSLCCPWAWGSRWNRVGRISTKALLSLHPTSIADLCLVALKKTVIECWGSSIPQFPEEQGATKLPNRRAMCTSACQSCIKNTTSNAISNANVPYLHL